MGDLETNLRGVVATILAVILGASMAHPLIRFLSYAGIIIILILAQLARKKKRGHILIGMHVLVIVAFCWTSFVACILPYLNLPRGPQGFFIRVNWVAVAAGASSLNMTWRERITTWREQRREKRGQEELKEV